MLKPTKKASQDFLDSVEKNLKQAQYGVEQTVETESPIEVDEISPSLEVGQDSSADYKLAEDIIEKIKVELDASCELFKDCLMSGSKLDLKKLNDHVSTSTSLIDALSAVYEAECSRLNEPETELGI